MKFIPSLLEGKIIKRYKRFFCDIQMGDKTVTAHVANTGSMTTCLGPGWPALVNYHPDPRRKLKYSLQMVHNGQSFIGVNTSLTNKLAVEAIKKGIITPLRDYDQIKQEVKTGDSRLDILLLSKSERCFVEVKNVTLKDENGYCLFPDAVSVRGQKHLLKLMELKKENNRAAMLFIVQREDVHTFCPAKSIDPTYAKLLCDAKKAGVEIMVYGCSLDKEKIEVVKPLPLLL